MIDFETVKKAVDIEEYVASHLEHVPGGAVCPACGSGTGRHRTPAMKFDGNGKWKCFSCGKGGDIFDLVAIVEGLDPSDKRAHLKAVAEYAGLSWEKNSPTRYASAAPKNLESSTNQAKSQTNDYALNRKSESEYIERCRKAFADEEEGRQARRYAEKRGFSLDEAIRYGFGYDTQKKRLVLPWKGNDYYHIDRDITESGSVPKYIKPSSDKVGAQPLYNPKAMDSDSFYVVEGVLDAIAMELMGVEAIALVGVGYRDLLDALNAKHYKGTVLVALDSDKVGDERSDALIKDLEAAGIDAKRVRIEGLKDAADALTDEAEREALKTFLREEREKALQERREKLNEAYRSSLARLRVIDTTSIVEGIYLLSDEPEYIPTGFYGLDQILGGGLSLGTIVLGAVSSLGKTTMAVNVAYNIAASGRSVLFVTIEQTAREIMAKVLSLMMNKEGHKVSTNELQSSKSRDYWNVEKNVGFMKVCQSYTESIAPYFHILEGVTQPTVEDIATVARMMAEHDGKPPVIFIDYLQILRPMNEHDSDKQAVDRNMTALRQLAGRDLKTPIFCISSLNRSSYNGTVSFDAFKESGAIEYGADVLLGLQPRGMADELDGMSDSKAKNAAEKMHRENKDSLMRECELTVLKNRSGRTPLKGIPFIFDVIGSTFTEE